MGITPPLGAIILKGAIMTYKNAVVITSTIFAFLFTALMAPAVFAETCDLTSLDCWGDGKKCNIKFTNLTGKASGTGGGTGYKQISFAANIDAWAETESGIRDGSKLVIRAGANKAINLDNKNFSTIQIRRRTSGVRLGGNVSAELSCTHITKILKGNSICRVFVGEKHSRKHTVVKCNAGDLVVPPAHKN